VARPLPALVRSLLLVTGASLAVVGILSLFAGHVAIGGLALAVGLVDVAYVLPKAR
jgi:hypothetical protein